MAIQWQYSGNAVAIHECGTSTSPIALRFLPEMILELNSIHAMQHIADGSPAQTFCAAITKFTDVPESDVFAVNWKSEPFKPVHYLAVDRKAGKIVISIRCESFDYFLSIYNL